MIIRCITRPQALLAAWLAFGGFAACEPALAVQPDVSLQKIENDWLRRQRRVSSVLYEVAGEVVVPKGAYARNLVIPPELRAHAPPRDHTSECRASIVLDLRANRVRREVWDEIYYLNKAAFYPSHEVHIFDGNRSKIYTPKNPEASRRYNPDPLAPDLWLVAAEADGGVVIEAQEWPVFVAHGIIPTFSRPIDAKHLLVRPNAEGMRIHGTAFFGGAECVVLRTSDSSTRDEFWVDPKRDSAVLRMSTYIDGILRLRSSVEYRATAAGHLPSSWTTDHYLERNKVFKEYRYTVKRLVLNPPLAPSSFDVPTAPGMIVMDVKQNQKFRVAEDGKTLVAITDKQRASVLAWCLLLSSAVLSIGFVVRYLWRRRRGGEAAGPP